MAAGDPARPAASPTIGEGQRFLAESLNAYGVSHVFMVPTVLVPALAEMASLGMVGVTTHSEKAAAYMADGYARTSGKPGICMAQTVGSSNLASGLREPKMMGAPVIAITGGRQPLTKHRGVYQEIVDFPAYEQLTKFNAEVDDVRRLPDLLRQAFRSATTGAPAPVHLELRGLGGEVLDDDLDLDRESTPLAESRFASAPAFRTMPDDGDLRAALEILEAADRPVALAGGGARTSGAQAELLDLARRLEVPVVTSLTGKGLIAETHELCAGCVGTASRPSAMRALQEADVVFAIGTRLGSQVTDNWRIPAPDVRVIQLDINPEELGRNYPNRVSIAGDARTALGRMAGLVGTGDGRRSGWIARVNGYVREFREEKQALLRSASQPIRPERICGELTAFLPDDAIFVADTGHAAIWTAGLIDLRPTQTFLRAGGSLGWSLPAAMGAKCAAPERPVVCFCGDGGLYYHLSELETAARHEINCVAVVNNNNSLSQDMKIFRHWFGGPDSEAGERMWAFRDVNLASLAEGFGCLGLRVEDAADIRAALDTALSADRPALVEIVTDPAALPDPPYGGTEFYFLGPPK